MRLNLRFCCVLLSSVISINFLYSQSVNTQSTGSLNPSWIAKKAQLSSLTPITTKQFNSADGKASGSGIFNHTSPISHVFNPENAPGIWLVPLENQQESWIVKEMPLPTGIDEKLRKEIDHERSRRLQAAGVKPRRSILNDPQTKKSDIDPKVLKGYNLPAGGGTPNDNHIAVGNDGKFVSVMNTVIRAHREDGTIARAFTLVNFDNVNKEVDTIPKMDRTYDPRVIYDPVADRYVVLYMHGVTDKSSFIVVGFSQTNDPTKSWNVYKIPGTPIADTVWSDYPIVSQTKEDIYFTVNLLANGSSWEEGFREAVIWQLSKQDGYDGKPLRKNFFHNLKYDNVSLWSICPMQNSPFPDGFDNYFLTVRPYAKQNDTVFLHRITNSLSSGNAQWTLEVLKSPQAYGFPPSALQPDTAYKLRTNDARVLSGIRLGNTIHYFQNSINFNTYQAAIMHGSIYDLPSVNRRKDISFPLPAKPTIKAKLFTHDSLDFGYPAVAAANLSKDEDGTFDPAMVVTTVHSSPWHFPSAGAFYINRYGEYSNYKSFRDGDSLIYYSFLGKGEQRWGDYEGIQAKFNEPGVFYAVGSYGALNLSMWGHVAKIQVTDTGSQRGISSVKVFPIPATEKVNIEFQTFKEGHVWGQLYTEDGKPVRTTRWNYNNMTIPETRIIGNDLQGLSASKVIETSTNPPSDNLLSFALYCYPGTHRFAVHTTHLAPGIYFLKVKSNGNFGGNNQNEYSFKIIIQP